jgi:hypothetical protein
MKFAPFLLPCPLLAEELSRPKVNQSITFWEVLQFEIIAVQSAGEDPATEDPSGVVIEALEKNNARRER